MAFGSSKKEGVRMQVSSNQSVLSQDLSVNGNILCSGLMRIEGKVEGSIKGEGEITIAESAKVKADIEAKKVIVLGEVQGNIKALESVEIVSSGKVYGDITTDKISIEEGAIFTGKCITKSPEKEKPPLKETGKTQKKSV